MSRRVALLAFLTGCGGPSVSEDVQHDVRGEWYGSLSHPGPVPWALGLDDIDYEGLVPTDDVYDGDWQAWSGTITLWGSADLGSVQPWFDDPVGVPVSEIVGTFDLTVCEDDIACHTEEDLYGPGAYVLIANFPTLYLWTAGTFDETALFTMNGEAALDDGATVLNSTFAVARVEAGSTDWDGTFAGSAGDQVARLLDLHDYAEADADGFVEQRGVLELSDPDHARVGPVQLFTCATDACDAGAYRLLADLNDGTFTSDGTLDGDALSGDATLALPGRPSLGSLSLTRSSANLDVGDP